MKINMEPLTRKHGLNARLSRIWEPVASRLGAKLTVRLTFESRTQRYLWLTDRGRQRMIKH